jgi:hypothetical protein
MVDSFLLLRMCPRLFIPKILIAFFQLPAFILFAYYGLQVGPSFLNPSDLSRAELIRALDIIVPLLLITLYSLVVDSIDFFLINPMYPLMVQDYYKKRKISFKNSLRNVLQRFGKIFMPLFMALVAILVVCLPLVWFGLVSYSPRDSFLSTILFVSAFLAMSVWSIFVYFLIYPIGSLENLNFSKTLKQTVLVSLKHSTNVLKAFIVFLLTIGISLFLSVDVWLIGPQNLLQQLAVFSLLIVVRFLMAIFTTYYYVLSTVFYFGFEKKQFFKVG